MKASVIVVVHAGAHHLEDSLGSLTEGALKDEFEVVVVDNGSEDGCGETAKRRYPWARVIRSEINTGFAGGVHLGADAASGEVLVFLNDDAAAEEDFVSAHLECLDANPGAAASAGRLVNWRGDRHDFVRGGVTFDCHAFQLGQGRGLDEVDLPTVGETLPFACGGNMAIRREDWDRSGGFDPELFAYFEDVELGWRLWATGREVVAAPEAVARHRGAATSSQLGDFRRGVLFERNALRTFFACADADCRAAFGNAVLMTFLHRINAFSKERWDLERLVKDPFGEGSAPLSRGDRWNRRLKTGGLIGSARHLVARLLLGRKAGSPVLEDGFLLMQLRAAQGFFDGLDRCEERRVELERTRTVPDREILTRFPRLIVPTYAGDEEWFGSDAFKALLPEDWPLETKKLETIIKR